MHYRKLILVLMFISLIRANYAVRVDTSENSESAVGESDEPKAEALTLLIQKRVPLRPNVKVIERRDDVVVIHKNARTKRKQTTRARRRPSNQFRSKIRPSSGSGNFGGFSSNDVRFPSFPSKPPRASNKLKYSSGSSKRTPSFNAQSSKPRPHRPSQVVKTISTVYGPPATSFNQIDTYNSPVTLQQAQNSFPTFSVETIEPIQQNFFSSGGNKNFNNDFGNDFRGGNKNFAANDDFRGGNKNFASYDDFGGANDYRGGSNDDFNQGNKNFGNSGGNVGHGSFNSNINFGSSNNNVPSHNEVNRFSQSSAINNFPLGEGSSFNVPKTSYGEPVRSASSQSTSSYQFNSIASNQQNANKNSNSGGFPKLPSRYETSDFKTPTRHNPLNANNFDFGNLDVLSESKNVLASVPGNSNRGKNRFNKFNNFDYEFGLKDYDDENDDDDDDDDSSDFVYTTRRPILRFTTTTSTTTPFPTTTKRSKKGVFGKRKRKLPQSHNLDADELRDAFTEASSDDFQGIKLQSDDYLNFDSMRNLKKNSNTPIHEIHSTLKAARKNPAFRQALGDDFQIVSIEKSLEQNPQNVDLSGFRLQRREGEENIQQFQEFSVGGELNFSHGAANKNNNMWNGDVNSFPRNHRFSK